LRISVFYHLGSVLVIIFLPYSTLGQAEGAADSPSLASSPKPTSPVSFGFHEIIIITLAVVGILAAQIYATSHA
jgi:aromatic amino acid permease